MYLSAQCPRCQVGVITSLSCPACGLVRARSGAELTLASPGMRLLAHIIATLIAFFTLGIGYLIWWFIVANRGYSPAKQLLGLRVITLDGRPAGLGTMLLRSFVGKYVLAVVTFSFYNIVDSLWLVWDKDRQCLHDKLAKTLVVKDDPALDAAHAVGYARQALPHGRPAPSPLPPARAWDAVSVSADPAEPQRHPIPALPPARPVAAAPTQDAPKNGSRPRPQRGGTGTPAERLHQLEQARAAGAVTDEQYRYWKRRIRREAAIPDPRSPRSG